MFRFITVFVLAFMAIACTKQHSGFIVEYDEVDGLKKEAPVLADGQEVGRVSEVVYTEDGRFDVHVLMQKEFLHMASKNTDFVISSHQGQTAIKILNASGPTLEEGERVKGASQMSALMNTFKQGVNASVDSMQQNINEAIDEISTDQVEAYLDTVEKEVDKLIESLDSLSESSRKNIKENWLPQLNSQIEKMKNKIDSEKIRESLNELETKMTELTKKLSG